MLSLAQYEQTLERLRRLEKLCVRAADALEEEFGSPLDPDYGISGPIHELISELRKAAL